ncbi:MAG: 3-phosphoshikimate 1-carboxyvinyltransferase [Methanomicrobiales archaeon]|nr:3-phosphoshikimate 1-carboxyvinyltransferase [Methanomicrobiales archaeon]
MEKTPDRVGPLDASFVAPPSKSYSHRAIIAAALADGRSVIRDPLYAKDTDVTVSALQALGAVISWGKNSITVEGTGGALHADEGLVLDMGDSGTSLRLCTTLALLAGSPVVVTGSARMQERPVGPLVKALNAIGGRVQFLGRDGFPPVRVAGSLQGGHTSVDASVSSQFVSSLLLAAPYGAHDTTITIPAAPVSRTYLDITTDLMTSFGVQVASHQYHEYSVRAGQHYLAREYAIEGDYSSASYFFALAAVCGGRVEVKNLRPDSLQGDRQFLDFLARMGCQVSEKGRSIVVERVRPLTGTTADMSSCPDTVQTLAVVAACAKTPSVITGIAHLRHKESDRIAAIATHLNKMGGSVAVEDDTLTIQPRPLNGTVVDPARDHRTAMSFAVLGLAIGGVTITGAECVDKSFPGFWEALSGVSAP